MSRDPNLAAGLPVRNAPFLAKDGKLVPADDSGTIVNGGFEQHKNHQPTGWRFVDQPGQITFIDQEVKCEGTCSLRMQDIGRHNPDHGHGRACQTIAVEPFRYPRASGPQVGSTSLGPRRSRVKFMSWAGLNPGQPSGG